MCACLNRPRCSWFTAEYDWAILLVTHRYGLGQIEEIASDPEVGHMFIARDDDNKKKFLAQIIRVRCSCFH